MRKTSALPAALVIGLAWSDWPTAGLTPTRAEVAQESGITEAASDGERWWIAAITTDFEGPGMRIP
jgi:hypothetical protein